MSRSELAVLYGFAVILGVLLGWAIASIIGVGL